MDTANNDTCKQMLALLDAFHDNELSGTERDSVRQHLEGCLPCAQQLAHTDRLVQALKTLPQKQLSAKFSENLDLLIDQQNTKQKRKPQFILAITAAAAILGIILGSGSWWTGLSSKSTIANQNSDAGKRFQSKFTIMPANKPNPAQQYQQIASGRGALAPTLTHQSNQTQNSKFASPRIPSAAEIAELPTGSLTGFNDALGIATDEDGLYELKM